MNTKGDKRFPKAWHLRRYALKVYQSLGREKDKIAL